MKKAKAGRLSTARLPIHYPVAPKRSWRTGRRLTNVADRKTLWLGGKSRRRWDGSSWPGRWRRLGFRETVKSGMRVNFVVVWCKEHDRWEYVPEQHHNLDLRYWYLIGLHPRFSVVGALLEAKQSAGEINRLMGRTEAGDGFNRPVQPTARRMDPGIRKAMKKAANREAFLRLAKPFLFVPLKTSVNGRVRRFRVRGWFREKHDARSFSPGDFFRVDNQELRRLVVTRGATVKRVLKGLKHVSTDKEGSLYDLPSLRRRSLGREAGRTRARYLYVKCPSTKQEYLLGVPNDSRSPRWARRWTFELPQGSRFVQEA